MIRDRDERLDAGARINGEGDALTVHRSHYDLRALLAAVTPENLHGEADTGLAKGREEW